MDERKLVSRLKKGDSAALERLIEEYTPYLYAIATSIMDGSLPPEDAEEIVSESFAALWYNRHKIQPGKLKAYLAAITRNRSISRLRALRLYQPLEDDIVISAGPEPERELLTAELSKLARAAVETLPEPDREIFKRHYFLFEKTGSIAAGLNMNHATVRTKLARGRRHLKDYFTERGYDCEDIPE